MSRPALRRWALVAALAGCLAAAFVGVPGASGAYTAKVTNSGTNTGTNPYFTCSSAVVGQSATKAYLAYPLSETAGTTATDATGNGNSGMYSTTGVTYNVANTANCPRDGKKIVTLNGTTGYVSGPSTAQPNPTVFSLEIWFRTTVAGGLLMGFGNARTGPSSTYDRHLYLDTSGHVIFGVYPNAVKTINSAPSSGRNYSDGQWHQAAASLSAAGMKLYVDGNLVDSDASVTTAENRTGYLRIGYDNLDGWDTAASGGTPASTVGNEFFKGNLAWAAVYGYALSATQVAQHYAAGA